MRKLIVGGLFTAAFLRCLVSYMFTVCTLTISEPYSTTIETDLILEGVPIADVTNIIAKSKFLMRLLHS